MKIARFEDIRAWQQARELTNLVYDLAEQARFSKDFRLRDQVQGAAGSIMHNAYLRKSKRGPTDNQ